MSEYKVDGITKLPSHYDPHEAIKELCGPQPDGSGRWKDSRENVARLIDNGTHQFYTTDGKSRAYLETFTIRSGNRCVRTKADASTANNLLNQPSCR